MKYLKYVLIVLVVLALGYGIFTFVQSQRNDSARNKDTETSVVPVDRYSDGF